MSINEIDATTDESSSDLIVMDIGKRDADEVKKLRKGKGKLLRRVNTTIEQLRDANKIKADAQIVVVVVREKSASLFAD